MNEFQAPCRRVDSPAQQPHDKCAALFVLQNANIIETETVTSRCTPSSCSCSSAVLDMKWLPVALHMLYITRQWTPLYLGVLVDALEPPLVADLDLQDVPAGSTHTSRRQAFNTTGAPIAAIRMHACQQGSARDAILSMAATHSWPPEHAAVMSWWRPPSSPSAAAATGNRVSTTGHLADARLRPAGMPHDCRDSAAAADR